MSIQSLGKVCVTPKGAWSDALAYGKLDIVTSGGESYLAKQAVPAGTALTDTDYWIKIASKGENGVGVPSGGTEGQVLVKASNADYATEWSDDLSQLKSAISGIEGSIAPVEASAIATAAHAVGELFVLNDTLLVALSAIAVGDTITTEGNSPNAAVTKLSEKLIKDIQVNGTSVVTNGVANVPIASSSNVGVVMPNVTTGIDMNPANGKLKIYDATAPYVREGTNAYYPITPRVQHNAAFYGLAKAAGADMASSQNAVGTYTTDALVKIQKMLGIYEAPWELICDDAVNNAEEADITISVDDNGNAFSLTDAIILVELEKQEAEYGSVGSYGRIQFRTGNSSYLNAYCGTTTGSTGTSRHAMAKLLQKNRMVECVYTTYGNGIISLPLNQHLNEPTTATESAPCRLSDTIVLIESIVIKSVKGKYNYRLYGRRNWRT